MCWLEGWLCWGEIVRVPDAPEWTWLGGIYGVGRNVRSGLEGVSSKLEKFLKRDGVIVEINLVSNFLFTFFKVNKNMVRFISRIKTYYHL